MNDESPRDRRGTLGSKAWRLSERASTALAGFLPAPFAPGNEPPPAGPMSPRLLRRALSRRTRARAIARLHLLPCFAAADYMAMHPDVATAGFESGFHALLIGATEGRRLFRPERLARALGTLAHGLPNPVPSQSPAFAGRPTPVGIYVSSLGNVFMNDIARDLAASLSAAGMPVTLRDEAGSAAQRPELCVFVAPHEFFLLGQGRAWIRDDVLAGAVMLNTEQPQTQWFASALPFLLAARGVIDLCPQHAAMFAATGLPALHLCPAPQRPDARASEAVRRHPLFRALPSAAQAAADAAAPLAGRALDIAFFGAETAHRAAWFARNAGFLADYDAFLYSRRAHRGPIRADAPDGALSALASHVCGHAKVMLNLHRDEFGYFEWHRIVRLGMASGSVVVSEPCPHYPGLLPGVHYLTAAARQIPDLLEWLLRSNDGRQRAQEVQDSAAHALATAFAPARAAARLLAFLRDCPAPA